MEDEADIQRGIIKRFQNDSKMRKKIESLLAKHLVDVEHFLYECELNGYAYTSIYGTSKLTNRGRMMIVLGVVYEEKLILKMGFKQDINEYMIDNPAAIWTEL